MNVRNIIATAGLVAVSITGGLIAAAPPAPFHLALSKAVPAADAVVAAAPAEIDLFFTQAPQIRATGLSLKTHAGAEVALADAKVDADDSKVVHVAVKASLAPGMYMVAWHAMASDGHVINGEYHFTYRPAAD